MAGGHMKYRTLSRTSSHRQALLRNLVTSLVKHESIHTTWHKAKEAQRLAEKLITLAKRDNHTAREKAKAILYDPHAHLPKLFGALKERYAQRPGGYTRVLRTQPKDTYSQAPAAILELVDGPRDVRFAMTAAAVARDRRHGRQHSELTMRNMAKVTRFRQGGQDAFEDMVGRVSQLRIEEDIPVETRRLMEPASGGDGEEAAAGPTRVKMTRKTTTAAAAAAAEGETVQ